MCHIPKNPYCDICRRSRMYRRKVTRKRHDPLEARGELEEVTKFGQRLALDFIVVNKSHANDKEAVVLESETSIRVILRHIPVPNETPITSSGQRCHFLDRHFTSILP